MHRTPPLLNFFFIILLFTACNKSDSGSLKEELITASRNSEIRNNIALWQESEITDYTFRYSIHCFCSPIEDIDVIVSEGKLSDAFYDPSGEQISDQKLDEIYTIDKFFERIQEAIDNNVDLLEVTYHPTFGYPEMIFINPLFGLADEEIGFEVKDFQITE